MVGHQGRADQLSGFDHDFRMICLFLFSRGSGQVFGMNIGRLIYASVKLRRKRFAALAVNEYNQSALCQIHGIRHLVTGLILIIRYNCILRQLGTLELHAADITGDDHGRAFFSRIFYR